MKNRYFKIALCCSLLLCSCAKSGEKFFEGDTSVHFNLKENQMDSIVCSFASTIENFFVTNLPVQIVGYADKTIKFRLKIDDSQTTAVVGKDYEPLAESYTMEAGVYQMNIPVKLLLSSDLDDRPVRLVFSIEPIDGLVAGISYLQKVVLVSTNDLPVISEEDWQWNYEYTFGTYSKTKHRYIRSILKIENFEDPDVWSNIDMAQQDAYGMELSNYFAENVVMDENGEQIEPWY